MNDSRDRVMDSLLTQHLGETPASMESRYARAFAGLDALDPGAAVPAGRTSSRTRLRRSARPWRRATRSSVAATAARRPMPSISRPKC